jgi:hypothetical protein
VSGDSHESSGAAIFHRSDGTVAEPVAVILTAVR